MSKEKSNKQVLGKLALGLPKKGIEIMNISKGNPVVILASDSVFLYRIQVDETEVAIRDGFDRWANSCEKAFSTPHSKPEIRKFFSDLDELRRALDLE